jgi:hypothetical protein
MAGFAPKNRVLLYGPYDHHEVHVVFGLIVPPCAAMESARILLDVVDVMLADHNLGHCRSNRC